MTNMHQETVGIRRARNPRELVTDSWKYRKTQKIFRLIKKIGVTREIWYNGNRESPACLFNSELLFFNAKL